MLLTLLFSVAVCYAIPLAQDAPPTVESLLRAESTCMDMVKAQELLKTDYQAAFWPRTNTGPMFRIFDDEFRKAGKNSHFMREYMKPWGYFQSWECNTQGTGTCPRLSCNDLGEEGKNRPYSAAAYQVMLSFANIGQLLKNIYDTLRDAKLDWAANQSTLTEIFNPTHDSQDSDQLLKQALNAMSTLVGIGAALSGNPAAGGVAALIGGTVTAATTAMDKKAEENKGDLARVSDLAKVLAKYFDAAMGTVNQELEHLVNNGDWQGKKLIDMFDNGAFADFTKLPLLNSDIMSVEDRRNIANSVTTAITINTAWRQQRTWIMRYPMTKEEFDTKKTAAGDWDSRLRYYKDGHGYYLQSVWPERSGSYFVPTYQNPPGWAEVWDEYKIPYEHVFESSIRSWNEAGFEGTIPIDWTKYFPNGATKDSVKKVIEEVTSYSGMFRVPICDLNMQNSGLKSVDAFLESMSPPGSHGRCTDADCAHRFASFCYCLNLGDSGNSGKSFRHIVDVGNWEGGSNPWCNG